jgi:hypothetical protein
MFRAIIVTATTLGLATQSYAEDRQFGRSAGIAGSGYSTAEIYQLRQIDEAGTADGGALRLRRIAAHEVSGSQPASAAPGAGRRALAASAGVSADGVDSQRLHQIIKAQEDREELAVRRLLAEAGDTVRPQGISPGRIQMARALGVDPAQHSIGELARLQRAAEVRGRDD